VIRVAAVGDVHCGPASQGFLAPHLQLLGECADLFLLAGDLTRRGDPAEAAVLAGELAEVPVPLVAVLGNHDYQSDRPRSVAAEMKAAGVTVLDPGRTVVEVDGMTVGIAGTKGFGGGFAGACASDFGEPEMKAFVRHTRALADGLRRDLEALDTDVRIALLHYSPVEETLAGERLEIFPFLGSYLLAEAVDTAGADLVVHGHAHAGAEKGVTPGGVHVRNVAQPVLRRAYAVYCVEPAAVRQPRLAGAL
jgi:Icc-related predicted phosphoesterase